MKHLFEELDALLRGRRTARSELAAGDIRFALPLSLQAVLLLAGLYGLCMGLFSLTGARSDAWLQIIASGLKLPALFLLTLVVTCPSLYVFSALAGSHLRFWPVIRLLMATIVVTVAVGASLAPILAFFTLSSRSYSFMVILNVFLLGASGLVGIGFLRRALLGLILAASTPEADRENVPVVAPAEAPPADVNEVPNEPGAYRSVAHAREAARPGETARRHAAGLRIFRFWLIAYAMVGAQMGWLLRPFIGSPDTPFTWFRAREGSFFLAVLTHLYGLFR
jgi:hypothetical protein